MQAKVQTKIDNSKAQISSVNETLERFYKGFRSFESMSVGDNFIIFKLASPARVKSAMEKAEQRIIEKDLPLQVIGGKHGLKHFIVKTI